MPTLDIAIYCTQPGEIEIAGSPRSLNALAHRLRPGREERSEHRLEPAPAGEERQWFSWLHIARTRTGLDFEVADDRLTVRGDSISLEMLAENIAEIAEVAQCVLTSDDRSDGKPYFPGRYILDMTLQPVVVSVR